MIASETATCPMCGREHCVVKEQYVQATRWEPMRLLGFQGYCPSCECSFGVARIDLRRAS